MYKFKGVVPVFAIIILCVIGVGAISWGAYYWYKLPKSGWQKIEGCVSSGSTRANYQFYGKENWQSVTPDMGCGKSYTDAETWGIKDKKINNETSDYSQITILLVNSKPSEVDADNFAYIQIPASDSYIELGRITAHTGSETIGISDSEWQYLKKSFRFTK